MLNLERIPDQVGYLVLTDDGAVVSSGGELENDERVANIITSLVTISDAADMLCMPLVDCSFQRISVTYNDHSYVVCLSNKKIHIVKLKFSPIAPEADVAFA